MECDTDTSKKEYYITNLKVFFLIHPDSCPFTKGVNLVLEVLASRIIYFSTGQYRCTISSFPLFFIFIDKYIYIYIYKIKIKVYHKTLPQFRTNYS